MQQRSGTYRKLALPGALGLALLALFLASCQRRPPAPSTPPPPAPAASAAPNYIDQGDLYFESADYPSAVSAYQAYLSQEPDGAQRERALYRLGLALALPANPARDPNQAITYLNQLATDYPKSSLRPEAELIAALERDTLSLHAGIEQREQQLAAMSRQIDGLKEQQDEVDQLQSDLKEKEDRIHQLSDELDKLKAIDLQRRPTAPPAR